MNLKSDPVRNLNPESLVHLKFESRIPGLPLQGLEYVLHLIAQVCHFETFTFQFIVSSEGHKEWAFKFCQIYQQNWAYGSKIIENMIWGHRTDLPKMSVKFKRPCTRVQGCVCGALYYSPLLIRPMIVDL